MLTKNKIMKLSLSKLKKVLLDEDNGDEMNEWIEKNIGDDDVSVREWLDVFGKFWNKWSDDYGDSEEIIMILINEYELSDSELDEVMMMYWECESIEEYRRDYCDNYDDYR